MLDVNKIHQIRLALDKGDSYRKVARDLGVSRNTVRKVNETGLTKFTYKKRPTSYRVLKGYTAQINAMLEENTKEKNKKYRRNGKKIWKTIKAQGCKASYGAVMKYIAKRKSSSRKIDPRNVFVSQVFDRGEAHQVDTSHEEVIL